MQKIYKNQQKYVFFKKQESVSERNYFLNRVKQKNVNFEASFDFFKF